jgi:type VI secretion system FHA domain protein
MSIIFKVIAYKGQPPIEPVVVTFDQEGGTIGRSQKNHFVLSDPDRYISRRHAVITYEYGSYFIEDKSLSGSYIRNKKMRVHNQKAELVNGDQLEIGEYIIAVSVEAVDPTDSISSIEEHEQANALDPMDEDDELEDSALGEVEKEGTDSGQDADSQKKYGDFESVVKFVDKKIEEVSLQQEEEAQKKQSLSAQDTPNQLQLPDEMLKIFLTAVGIEDSDFLKDQDLPDLIERIGAVFRELVAGLMALIRGRAEAKKQLRIEGTLLGPNNNNPIKFSTSLEETIKIVLGSQQAGFVSGIAAIRESYADVMGHQIAMTIGIQAALKKTLQGFNPKRYARRYKKNLSFLQKAKCWDDYSQDYQTIVIKSLEKFLDDEFVRAYQEQVDRLSESADD